MKRRHSYQATFRAPAARLVLADLARFCRANDTTFHADDRAHALLEGRREVWLRISQHLHLDADELFHLYSGERRPAKGITDVSSAD
jgi:hypothetical protein